MKTIVDKLGKLTSTTDTSQMAAYVETWGPTDWHVGALFSPTSSQPRIGH